jgi:hypothetical protein
VGLILAATIRSDRYEAMQKHPALAEVNTVLFDELKAMPRPELLSVIIGPALRAREGGQQLDIAPDLMERLIDDAAQGANTLPLLSLALARLYADRGSEGKLTLSDYEYMGGMRGVVDNEMEAILPPDGIVRLVIGAAEVDDLGVDTPEGDHRGRGVVQGPPVSGGDHRALRMAVSPLPAELP